MAVERLTVGRRWLAACVSVVLAFGGCDNGSGGERAEESGGCAVPTAPAGGVDGQADAAPGGGGLHVVESGFSQLGSRGSRVSLGAVVENTSAMVAYRTHVTFSYTDARKRSAVPAGTVQLALEIPVVLPGQRVPVGTWAYVRNGRNGTAVTVADIQVGLGAVRWVADHDIFAPLSARVRSTTRFGADPVSGTISYTTTSGYCRPLSPRGVGIVFRNHAGAVVGGSLDLGSDQQRCQPGTAAARALAALSVPPGVDDSKTEVYPYCDLAPASATTGPGGPVN